VSATRELPIATNGDVVVVRQQTRILAAEIGLSLVDQTKIVTAASELARNALVHAGGGRVLIEMLEGGRRPGLRLVFTDEGPGIPDIAQALTEGWSTAGGLGLGLSGSRRLVDEFDLVSAPGEGTRVTVTKWGR